MSMNNQASYQQLPFSEQINFFKRKLNLPTDSYADLEGKDHDYAFVVAGANRNDMLADFRKAVDKAIEEGTTLHEFRKDFDSIVKKYGWDYHGGRNWRSKVIYDTNLYSSFSAGRYEQHQRMKKYRPYLQYKHRDGVKNPRPLHQSWDGLVLHIDDPWWQTHYPINEYNCHCYVISHSTSSLKREGLIVSKSPPINYVTKELGKRSGNPKIVTLPEGIGYGFDRIPGTDRVDMPSKLLLDKAISVPPKLASNMVSHALSVPEVQKLWYAGHKKWVDDVSSGDTERLKTAENIRSVGVLSATTLQNLEQLNIFPESAVIAMDKGQLIHALRSKKQKDGIAVPLAFWQALPKHLQNPKAILLDDSQSKQALLFVYQTANDDIKIVVTIDYATKANKQAVIVNMVTTGSTLSNVSSLGKYQLIEGSLDRG